MSEKSCLNCAIAGSCKAFEELYPIATNTTIYELISQDCEFYTAGEKSQLVNDLSYIFKMLILQFIKDKGVEEGKELIRNIDFCFRKVLLENLEDL